MGLFEHWPYVNFHDLNLDWIIKEFPKVYASRDEAQAYADASAESAAASQLSADAALASQEAAHQSELNASEDAESLAGKAEQVDLNTSRINNILVQGTTTEGNAELIDIRTAYDSIVYDLAGNAVREQIKDAHGNISGIADATETTKIKNLINPKEFTRISYASNPCYEISNDNLIVLRTDSNSISSADFMTVLKAGTYTISVTNPLRIQVFADGASISDGTNDRFTFNISQESNIYIKLIATSYPYTVGKIQIEKGTVATAYTDYSDPVYSSNLVIKNNEIQNNLTTTAVRSNFVLPEGENQGTIENGVLRYTDNTVVDVGVHTSLAVAPGDTIFFKGYCYNSAFPVIIFRKSGSVTMTAYGTQGNYYGNVLVPFNADEIIVNSNNEDNICIYRNNGEVKSAMMYLDDMAAVTPLKGKNIVWFGTSIPAGGYIGADVTRNYPSFIAEKYGCTVHNEAIGSSCAHCKELNMISTANPYGFNPNYTLSSRCLSNTHEEMQWMIDHYNDSFWTNKPTLTDEYKQQMMSFSYETKIDKYLTDETFPDLFVFDHGFNDYVAAADNYTGHEYEPYTLKGALNFLIRRIYSYNPAAKIIIIGNYKYQTRNGLVVEAQKDVSTLWDIPIFETWKHTGLSDLQVYTDFTWTQSGGAWTMTPSAEHLETLTNVLLPDGVHPHSRPDNLIIDRMADAIGSWLKNI